MTISTIRSVERGGVVTETTDDERVPAIPRTEPRYLSPGNHSIETRKGDDGRQKLIVDGEPAADDLWIRLDSRTLAGLLAFRDESVYRAVATAANEVVQRVLTEAVREIAAGGPVAAALLLDRIPVTKIVNRDAAGQIVSLTEIRR